MTKDLIKLLIIEYQAYVTQVELVHRDVELMDGLNYVFVGLRHAGKSYLMYQRIAQLLNRGISGRKSCTSTSRMTVLTP